MKQAGTVKNICLIKFKDFLYYKGFSIYIMDSYKSEIYNIYFHVFASTDANVIIGEVIIIKNMLL